MLTFNTGEDISSNENITLKDVLDNLDKPWEWRELSMHCKIKSIQDVIDTPQIPWDFRFLSSNPNLTLNDLANNIDLPWDWRNLSFNTFEIDLNKFHLLHKGKMQQVCAEIEFAPEGTFGSRMRDGGIEWQNQKRIFEGN